MPGALSSLADVFQKMNIEPLSAEEYARRKVEQYNKSVGNLTGYDCPECLNRGYIAFLDDKLYEIMRPCKCMNLRKTLRLIERSGLKELMERYTFDRFQTSNPWQKHAKEKAQAFLSDHDGKWFFAGGQVGAGKTHLCTAIVGELLRQGTKARYMIWDVESKKLKAVVNDDEAYEKAITGLRETEVLYIDDFLKTKRGASPTDADVKLAFEIVNYRYNNTRLTTLISSEFTLDEIINIDEATGSRILERSGQYALIISKDRAKNWRISHATGGQQS